MDLENHPLILAPVRTDIQADVLIHHFHGAMDAGRAGRDLIEHLRESLNAELVAEFAADKLIDYRSHRPWLRFENWSFTEAKLPRIRLEVLRDDNGRNLLLLHGPEPDLAWQSFLEVITEFVRVCGVKKIVTVMGMPAGVPHTRPTPVHLHGARPESLPPQPEIGGFMQVPAGFDQVLEYHLGTYGADAMGLIAAVPYYLSEGNYPPATAALAAVVSDLTELALPVGDLEAASAMTQGQVAQMISDAEEATELIEMLEKNFDNGGDSKFVQSSSTLQVPTSEEIGARLEAFLAANDRENGTQISDLANSEGAGSNFDSLRQTPYQNRHIRDFLVQKQARSRGRHRAEGPTETGAGQAAASGELGTQTPRSGRRAHRRATEDDDLQ